MFAFHGSSNDLCCWHVKRHVRCAFPPGAILGTNGNRGLQSTHQFPPPYSSPFFLSPRLFHKRRGRPFGPLRSSHAAPNSPPRQPKVKVAKHQAGQRKVGGGVVCLKCTMYFTLSRMMQPSSTSVAFVSVGDGVAFCRSLYSDRSDEVTCFFQVIGHDIECESGLEPIDLEAWSVEMESGRCCSFH